MSMLMAEYHVQDFDRFVDEFEAFDEVRAEYGATTSRVLRDPGNAAVVVVVVEFPDAGRAAAFAADPRRIAALGRASVTARTDRIFGEV